MSATVMKTVESKSSIARMELANRVFFRIYQSANLLHKTGSRAVEKPAYWRIVQGRPAYIDARTPRVNGAKPGRPGSPASSAV